METPKILPHGTTKEQWDKYQLDLKNHNAWCDSRESFARDVIWMVQNHGAEKTKEMIKSQIYDIRFLDAPNAPGYYRANND